MDKIEAYPLYKDLTEQSYTLPKNSHVLSIRKDPNEIDLLVDILVDLDNKEMIKKTFMVFTQYSSIADDMKANFIGTVVFKETDEVFYIFEKIR